MFVCGCARYEPHRDVPLCHLIQLYPIWQLKMLFQSFHWNCYTPEVRQIKKLRILSIMRHNPNWNFGWARGGGGASAPTLPRATQSSVPRTPISCFQAQSFEPTEFCSCLPNVSNPAEIATKSRKNTNFRKIGGSTHRCENLNLNLYRGIWVSGFSGSRGCSILSRNCHSMRMECIVATSRYKHQTCRMYLCMSDMHNVCVYVYVYISVLRCAVTMYLFIPMISLPHRDIHPKHLPYECVRFHPCHLPIHKSLAKLQCAVWHCVLLQCVVAVCPLVICLHISSLPRASI